MLSSGICEFDHMGLRQISPFLDQPYRGRSFTGRIASASPDAPEPEFRIHSAPAVSLQTFGSWQASSASDDAKQHAAKLDKLAKEPRIPWSRPKQRPPPASMCATAARSGSGSQGAEQSLG